MESKNNEMNMETQGAGDTAPYVLRPIKAPDVFQFVRVLSKIGLSDLSTAIDGKLIVAAKFEPPTKMESDKRVPLPEDEWTESARRTKDKAEAAQSQLTVQVIGLILENLPNCENELYTLLANSIDKPVDYVRDMDATTFIHLIDDYISRDGFMDFFTEAAKLLSSSRRKFALPT